MSPMVCTSSFGTVIGTKVLLARLIFKPDSVENTVKILFTILSVVG